MKRLCLLLTFLAGTPGLWAGDPKPTVQQLVPQLMADEHELRGIPFAEVVKAATGKQLLPFNPADVVDCALLARIGAAMDKVLERMNAPGSPAQQQKRINEVSAHFENALKSALNEIEGFSCDFPKTAAGKIQRSGYPDLRLVDKASGRVVYLDPKLYEEKSRASSLRTFYFEPRKETNKVLDDAHHLIVGIAHDGKNGEAWKFLSWELVDLSRFRVRLKAEFQGSNRDLYLPETIVGTSRK